METNSTVAASTAPTTTVEMVVYKLKPGVTGAQVAATNDGINEFLKAQPGFYYRSLSCDDSDQWFDLAYWQDMAAAKAGGEAFMQSAAGLALVALIDDASILMRHMEVMTEASACTAA